MLKTRHLLIVFLPALILALFVLFIRLIQYEPLYPEPKEETAKTSSIIPIYPDDPLTGSKKALATIIIFSDFGCSHCKTEMMLLDELIQKYPDKVKVVWKNLSVARFPHSTETAHEYGFCASQQDKFKQFADLAFANSDNLTSETVRLIAEQVELDKGDLEKCLASGEAKNYLQKTEALAMGLGIQAVPTIFVNNKQVQTPQLLEEWEGLLNF